MNHSEEQQELTRIEGHARPRPRRGHNKMDKWDRIKQHLLHGDDLPPDEAETVERSQIIWGKLIEGETERDVVNFIVQQGWVKERRAYILIRDAKRIFGLDPVGASLAAEKKLLIEQAKELYKLCLNSEKYREANSALKLIKDILATFSDEQNLADLYKTLDLPETYYTSDPKVLELPPVQDSDYEEV